MKCSRCHEDTTFFKFEVIGRPPEGLPVEIPVCGTCHIYIVDPIHAGKDGTYTTIQAAIDAARLGGGRWIVVRCGTYKENLTI